MATICDVLGFVASHGYGAEIQPALALCRRAWAEDPLLLRCVANVPLDAQDRTRLMAASSRGDVERMR